MKVPKNWNQVTVDQYQQALPFYKKAIEEPDSIKSLDNWSAVIAILTNSQLDTIQSMDIGKLKAVIKKLSFLSETKFYGRRKHLLFHNNTLYKAPKEAREFSTAMYVDYKTFLGRDGGMISNLHFILATIYEPYFKTKQSHEKRANEFKGIAIGKVYPVVFFYSIAYRNSIKRIQEYGIKIAEEKIAEAQSILMETLRETLEDIGGGTVQSTNSQMETLLKKMS